jgi:2,4'-dihydroxyacetophenone dioxygenase
MPSQLKPDEQALAYQLPQAAYMSRDLVHGGVFKGRWHYLEHDWVAEAGGYAFEPAGETHTLVVPDDVPEMITWFHVTGGYTYVDPHGVAQGYEDVFTKIEAVRSHYAAIGLPETEIARIIR